jgi:hypothetical protein
MPCRRDWWVRGALILLAQAAPGTVAFAQNPSGEVVGVIPDASALRSDGR